MQETGQTKVALKKTPLRIRLKTMKQFTGEKKYPAFSIFKTGMRVANAMPKLKSKLIPA